MYLQTREIQEGKIPSEALKRRSVETLMRFAEGAPIAVGHKSSAMDPVLTLQRAQCLAKILRQRLLLSARQVKSPE
jgi:hypothetical protein